MTGLLELFREYRMRFAVDLPVSPKVMSSMSVVSSLTVFINPFAAVSLALAFDLLDGAVARAKGVTSKEGGLFDYSCDRLSEFIFASYYMPAVPFILFLPAFNTFLMYRRISGRGFILPLRSILLFAVGFGWF